MHAEYFLVLGAILFFPLLLSVIMRLRIYTRFRAFLKTMIIVCTVFWIWDIVVTIRGHWSFNPDYTVGWRPLGMPVEEWLFFPILVFVSIFTYEAVRKVAKHL